MNIRHILVAALVLLAAGAVCAPAQELAVYADESFRDALKEIAPLFKETTGFEAHLVLGRSDALAARIVAGATADLFFPASEESLRQVMEKGLVDVALKRNILMGPPAEPVAEDVPAEPQYVPAAVLLTATHRLQAMAFLEYLVSEPARSVFARQGFTLP